MRIEKIIEVESKEHMMSFNCFLEDQESQESLIKLILKIV